jgi:hypothetical protein
MVSSSGMCRSRGGSGGALGSWAGDPTRTSECGKVRAPPAAQVRASSRHGRTSTTNCSHRSRMPTRTVGRPGHDALVHQQRQRRHVGLGDRPVAEVPVGRRGHAGHRLSRAPVTISWPSTHTAYSTGPPLLSPSTVHHSHDHRLPLDQGVASPTVMQVVPAQAHQGPAPDLERAPGRGMLGQTRIGEYGSS